MDRRTFLKGVPAMTMLAATRPGLATELKLRPEQRVLYAQTVGYPA
jgi:hypothetical protein